MKNRFPDVVSELKESPDRKVKGPSPYVGIIIHHTGIGSDDPKKIDAIRWGQRLASVVGWLTASDPNYVSAHFVIGREGECVQLVDPDGDIAFHAGVSEFFHPLERKIIKNWNQFAVGVELVGDGDRGDYSDDQYHTLSKLCAHLMERYKDIDPRCIVGHENISIGRKTDPGRYFDWRRFTLLLGMYRQELEQVSR